MKRLLTIPLALLLAACAGQRPFWVDRAGYADGFFFADGLGMNRPEAEQGSREALRLVIFSFVLRTGSVAAVADALAARAVAEQSTFDRTTWTDVQGKLHVRSAVPLPLPATFFERSTPGETLALQRLTSLVRQQSALMSAPDAATRTASSDPPIHVAILSPHQVAPPTELTWGTFGPCVATCWKALHECWQACGQQCYVCQSFRDALADCVGKCRPR